MAMLQRSLVCAVLLSVSILCSLSLADVPAKEFAGYWPLEEGKGDVTADVSGNGNEGKIISPGGIQWIDGMVGRAILFDGVAYAECGMGKSLMDAQAGSQSLTFWMRPSKELKWTDNEDVLRSDLVYMRNGPMCAFRGNQKGSNVAEDSRGSIMFWAGGVPSVLSKTKVWAKDTWYHIAVSISKEAGTVALYVNGKEEASRTAVNPRTAADMAFWFGGSQWWKFPGAMDEIKYWTRALTAAEIVEEASTTTSVSSKDKLATVWGGIK